MLRNRLSSWVGLRGTFGYPFCLWTAFAKGEPSGLAPGAPTNWTTNGFGAIPLQTLGVSMPKQRVAEWSLGMNLGMGFDA